MKKAGILILVIALIAGSFGLGFVLGRNTAGGSSSGDTADDHQAESSQESLGETALKVGDREVGMAEVSFYMYLARDKYVAEYGEDPWSRTTDDGEQVGDYAKRIMLSDISVTQSLVSEAAEMDISLTDDEKADAIKNADKYLDSIGEIAAGFGITKAGIEKVYTDEALARKVYEKLTEDAVRAVEDEDRDGKLSDEEKSDLVAEKLSEMTEELKAKYPAETTELWDSLVMGSVG